MITYKIEIFAGFRKEKTFHPVFQTHIQNIVNCCIATFRLCVRVQALDDFSANMEVKWVLGRLHIQDNIFKKVRSV